MAKFFLVLSDRRCLFTLFSLSLATAVLVFPSQIGLKAGSSSSSVRQVDDPGFDNYDIRTDEAAYESLMKFRSDSGQLASDVANIRDRFVEGEKHLRTRVPKLDLQYNMDLRIPELIGTDVWDPDQARLTSKSSRSRSTILREFIAQNADLFGTNAANVDALVIGADYTNPDGNISYVRLEQQINGISVFPGEITAAFTNDGEIFRIVNNIAPGVEPDGVSRDFGDVDSLTVSALRNIGDISNGRELRRDEPRSSEKTVVFQNGGESMTAEKIYFPTEPGVVRSGWLFLVSQGTHTYYVILDAATHALLWRKNLTDRQTESSTYQVYNNPNGYLPLHDSPAPLSPGPNDPTTGKQGAIIGRTNVTLIGNEGDLSFNNLGWIDDGRNITDGNALEAGIDRVAPNGVDAPVIGDPYRVFSSTWNPPPGNPPPGDQPLDPQAQRGAVIQMFYMLNRWHDEMYKRGFTEAARNFQHDNFGRGGLGNDRVSAEAQDSSGTNGANFFTPADGARPRLQVTIWTGPDPDRDAAADAQVVLHEMTHGLTNRLHGNASGLGTNMARAMGEGWSDWYALTMLASEDDDPNGIHAVGGYITHLITPGFVSNYYYGIRRFPQARISSVGANGLPHNPLTFRYLNSDCNTLIGTTTSNPPPSSAFPRGPIGVTQCDQVHNGGEVWSSALWEVRSVFVDRLGFNIGTRDVLQVVTDGMKLSPLNPTFLQARDAIIAAAAAISPQHAADVREGFRRRGMGYSAAVINAGTGSNNTVVIEAFDTPNVVHVDPFSVSDTPGDGDGYPESGENVLLSIPIQNSTGAPVSNVQVSVNGSAAFDYGTIANGQTVTNQVPYTIPVLSPCTFTFNLSIVVSSANGTNAAIVRTIDIGPPLGGPSFPFTNATPIDLPGGQPTTTAGPSAPYPSTIDVSGLVGYKRIRVTLNGFHHDWENDIDLLLVGPAGQRFIILSDAGGSSTESLPPRTFSIADSATLQMPSTPFIAGAAYKPTNIGANDPFDPPAPASPYESPAPAGTATFESVFGLDGTAMNGTWSLYGDDDVSGDGGRIDGGWTITFEPLPMIPVCPPANAPFDFDGDGRTDISIFRPSVGEWWYLRSSGGHGAAQFGTSTDVVMPADYDGDGKSDIAFFRPSSGEWFVLRSSDSSYYSFPFGSNTDIAAPGDFDGDLRADPAVFRPSTGEWFILRSSGGTEIQTFGVNGDRPVPADFDGDGKADLAIFRPSNGQWWVNRSTTGIFAAGFGQGSDRIVVGDYNGDAKADLAFFRPASGEWFVLRSSDFSYYSFPFGLNGDVPVPGDYDGDGKTDAGVFRPGTSTWYLNRSTSGLAITTFGSTGDSALPSAYVR